MCQIFNQIISIQAQSLKTRLHINFKAYRQTYPSRSRKFSIESSAKPRQISLTTVIYSLQPLITSFPVYLRLILRASAKNISSHTKEKCKRRYSSHGVI